MRAVDLLARREHSVQELARKLRQKGFEADQIDNVIQRLLDEGYLSERRYVESYLRSRACKGFGPLKIRVELKERGISEALIRAVFDELPADYWHEGILLLWDKKFAARFDGSPEAKAKCVRYMQYKGFPNQDIFQLIDEKVKR